MISFNALIEGTYPDDLMRFHFKIARLDVPTGITLVNDGVYQYHLNGMTTDFRDLYVRQRASGEKDVEHKVDSLVFCEGIVLPYRGGNTNVLDRPRSILLDDGRFFTSMENDREYLRFVREIIKVGKEVFSNHELSGLYKRIVLEQAV